MTHHHHSVSIVYLRATSWWCTFHGFGQMCNTWTHPLEHRTDQPHCPQNPLLFPLTLHLAPPLETNDIFVSQFCFFSFFLQNCHLVGIIPYAAYSDWLLSLTNLHYMSSTCSWLLAHYFLVLNNTPLSEWTTAFLSISYLQILAIMNKTAINMCVLVFVWTAFYNSCGEILRNGISGLSGKSMFQ